MKPFRFQQFSIRQSPEVFRVGTDAVLLGALCSVAEAASVLEVGTGTGIVSLMLAQRNPEAEILAIDLNESAVELARKNFGESPFCERLRVAFCDFKSFSSARKFDVIVCNPPFFEANASEKDVLARQQTELNFFQLLEKSAGSLASAGKLCVIVPAESGSELEAMGRTVGLFLQKKINIYGRQGGKVRRLVLEFSLQENACSTEDFVVEKSPRQYSDQYLELTKEFHVFEKSFSGR